MGIIKGSLKLLVPINAVKAPVVQAKYGISFLKEQIQQIFIRTKLTKESNQSVSNEKAVEVLASKEALYEAWGIEEDNYTKVKKGLLVEIISYLSLAILAVATLLTDLHYFIYWMAALAGAPLFLFVAMTKLWRYECVSEGRFTPFKVWLFKK